MERYSWDVCDELLESPHVLIAGTTGSGKSVLLNSLIFSAMNGRGLFYFIDLKRVELSRYKNMYTTLGMATEPYQVKPVLDTVVEVMEDRYSSMSGVKCDGEPIYVVIDELADLVFSCEKSCLDLIVKIGRLGRAANIHLICATQDPSKKTLSAQLMQNFTTRVALRCFSPIESRQIIGVAGAETLPQYGYALVRDASGVRKMQVPLTLEGDIQSVTKMDNRPQNSKLKNVLYAMLEFFLDALPLIATAFVVVGSFIIRAVIFLCKIFLKLVSWEAKLIYRALFGEWL